jgi:hypothetical protein
MPAMDSLKQSILTEGEDDHVGLWSVVRDVEEALPNADEAGVRTEVLRLLHDLLDADEIQAGFPTHSGRGFRRLQLSPARVIARIEEEWPVGRRPTIGEGLWFTKAKRTT